MTNPSTREHGEPTATTAGEQDHENIEQFRGEPADPPEDTGKPPEQS